MALNLRINHTRWVDIEVDVDKFIDYYNDEWNDFIASGSTDKEEFIRESIDEVGPMEYMHQAKGVDDGVTIIDSDDEYEVDFYSSKK